MRRVAGKKDPSLAPTLGHERIEGVDEAPQHIHFVDVDVAGEKRTNSGRILHLLLGLTGHQQELEPVVAVRLRTGDGRRLRVAMEVEVRDVAEAVLPLFRLDVDDKPGLGEALADHLEAEARAHAAAAAIAGNEPLRPHADGLCGRFRRLSRLTVLSPRTRGVLDRDAGLVLEEAHELAATQRRYV